MRRLRCCELEPCINYIIGCAFKKHWAEAAEMLKVASKANLGGSDVLAKANHEPR